MGPRGEPPLVSVFTAVPADDPAIETAYRSLLRQSYPAWEWVVVDASGSAAASHRITRLVEAAPKGAIHAVTHHGGAGTSAAIKAVAANACRGAYLVELDPGHELLPDALEVIAATFLVHPDIDFLYCDWIDWARDAIARVPPEAAPSRFCAFERVESRNVPVVLAPPLTGETLRDPYATPICGRAWQAGCYHRIHASGAIEDEHTLVVRTFLEGNSARVPRPLVVEHRDLREPDPRVDKADGLEQLNAAIDRRCLYFGVSAPRPAPLTDADPLPGTAAVIDVVAEAAADRGAPLVSVVVTASQSRGVARAVESALAQRYHSLEVLVSGNQVEEALRTVDDPRVRHATLPMLSGSRASARNFALKAMARGTLVAYLDEEGTWREDHLESLIDLLIHDPGRAFALAEGQTDASELLHRRYLLEQFGYWRDDNVAAMTSRWHRD
jgi:hypothetical protein